MTLDRAEGRRQQPARDRVAGEAPSSASSPASSILVLRKARRVLDAFSVTRPALTAREVQVHTGLPATTCTRLLRTLVEEGFLDRRGDRFAPGLATLGWATIAKAGIDVVAIAQPVLAKLRQDTGESAYLYMRDGLHHVCVAVEQSEHAVVQILRVGQVLPLHAGSAGRVFLAYAPGGSELLESVELTRFTEHTVTDRGALRAAVAEVRRTGFAATFEERSVGAASLSAPVLDQTGALLAVIGMAAPRQRFDPSMVRDLAPHVMSAAADLSRAVGYTPTAGGDVEGGW